MRIQPGQNIQFALKKEKRDRLMNPLMNPLIYPLSLHPLGSTNMHTSEVRCGFDGEVWV